MTAWGVFDHVSKKPSGEEYNHQHIILLGAWNEQVDAVRLKDIAVDGWTDDNGVRHQSHCQIFQPTRLIIEKRASGIVFIQELRKKRVPAVAWLPPGKPGAKGKIPRAHSAAAILEQGSVWYVPGKKTEMVLDQCAAFPFAKHDDLVDTVTMALIYFRNKHVFKTHEDELDEDELKEAMIQKSEQRRSKRTLYSGPVNRGDDYDEADIKAMTPETRRRLYG
jgi:hypothetical protein